jgi:hypothetical protein
VNDGDDNLQPEETSDEEEDSPVPLSTPMTKSEMLAKSGHALKN